MPAHRTTHPSHEQLIAFGQGRLDASSSADIERHVADCPACCQVLRGVPDDTLLGRLRASDTSTDAHLRAANEPAALDPGPEIPAELLDHPRYRVIKLLGYGGMGVVYQAEHRIMERPAALKVISRSLTNNAQAVDRFRREVKAAGKLAHANIVAAYDADQAGDLHFLVMEFVDGVSLARLVEKRGPLPVVEACNCVRQAAMGLQHAHKSGMVHRDIKPQNLMLSRKGQIKILDFGLARFAREIEPVVAKPGQTTSLSATLTSLGTVLGTPDYIAPEQTTDSHQVDIRSDIYSLGCTLYFLLAGHTPFPHGSVMDKLVWHRDGTPRPIRQSRPDLPPEVAQIVEKMMAKDPAERYQTPQEVVQALAGFSKPTADLPLSTVSTPTMARAMAPTLSYGAVPGRTADQGPGLGGAMPTLDNATDWTAGPAIAWNNPANIDGYRRRRSLLGYRPRTLVMAVACAAFVVAGLSYVLAGLGRNRDTADSGQADLGQVDSANIVSKPPQSTSAKTPAAAVTRRGRVLFVLPSVGFYYPDYAPVRRVLEQNGVEVVVASTTTTAAQPDPGGGGEPVTPDIVLDQAHTANYDAIVFGGGWGVKELKADRPAGPIVARLVRDMLGADKPVAALCMGSAVLAEAGVLRGKRATSFHSVKGILQARGAEWVDEPVVVSDRIITGRGPQDATQFAQTLLDHLGNNR